MGSRDEMESAMDNEKIMGIMVRPGQAGVMRMPLCTPSALNLMIVLLIKGMAGNI